MLFALRHLRLVKEDKIIDDGYIVIDKGKIVEIGEEPLTIPQVQSEDLSGYIALPGFIDTHIHGVEGLDLTLDPEAETLLEMSHTLIKYGVTSFVPSTVTAPHNVLLAACRAVREAKIAWDPSNGSRIIGLHLEGPYINKEMAGAQNPAYIRKPSTSELSEYIDASGNNIVQVTIAPELEGASEFIHYAINKGIVVSAGHTNASYEEGIAALKNGITKATHLFNGMRRLHHRDPGIALALMEDPKVYLELIVDYIHVHPAMVKHVIKYAGANRVVLITDAIAAAGLGDGVYELGGLKVKVDRGIAKLVDKDTLAGSTLTLDKAFKNSLELGLTLIDISKMTSVTPANSLGLDGKLMIGKLEKGYLADITILDEDYEVKRVYIEGELVYES